MFLRRSSWPHGGGLRTPVFEFIVMGSEILFSGPCLGEVLLYHPPFIAGALFGAGALRPGTV